MDFNTMEYIVWWRYVEALRWLDFNIEQKCALVASVHLSENQIQFSIRRSNHFSVQLMSLPVIGTKRRRARIKITIKSKKKKKTVDYSDWLKNKEDNWVNMRSKTTRTCMEETTK